MLLVAETPKLKNLLVNDFMARFSGAHHTRDPRSHIKLRRNLFIHVVGGRKANGIMNSGLSSIFPIISTIFPAILHRFLSLSPNLVRLLPYLAPERTSGEQRAS